MMKRNMLAALLCGMAFTAWSGEYYVNNLTGEDSNPGNSADVPFRTIAKAVSKLQGGDTLILAKNTEPYRETLPFSKLQASASARITVEGNNAVLSGSDPVDPAEWQDMGNGLYKNTVAYDKLRFSNDIIARYFFVFEGRLNSMGRCMKGANVPLKKPDELQKNEWTFVEAEKAFYLKIDPALSLAEAKIEMPRRHNGVAIHNDADFITVRNIIATNVFNDGYSLSGSGSDNRFENIQAIDCGDDGISAHAESSYVVDGFYASGNGTGICDTGNSRTIYNNILIENIRGVDVYFLAERSGKAYHEIRNGVIIGNGAKQIIFDATKPDSEQQVVFVNVAFIGRATGDRFARLSGNSDIEFTDCIFVNFDWSNHSRNFSASRTIFKDAGNGLNFKAGVKPVLSDNLYAARHIRLGQDFYSAPTWDKYRELIGDQTSILNRDAKIVGISAPFGDKNIGVDVTKFAPGIARERAEKLSQE